VANMGDLIFRGNVDETEVGQLVTGMPMRSPSVPCKTSNCRPRSSISRPSRGEQRCQPV
jgi:hypothetical protein